MIRVTVLFAVYLNQFTADEKPASNILTQIFDIVTIAHVYRLLWNCLSLASVSDFYFNWSLLIIIFHLNKFTLHSPS